ncbi:MAG: LuxR C-terminal-related transcriptional regulator [Thermodesulfobacteriota bacterium]
MDYRRFSKNELVEILDIIDSSARCKGKDGMMGILERLSGLVSADYSICGIGQGTPRDIFGPPLIINGNYPVEWLTVYGGEELYKIDPLIHRNFGNPGPQIWEETYSMYSEDLSPTFLTSKDFGLNHGISSGLYNNHNLTGSLISFSASTKNFGNHQKGILDAVTPHLHQALIRVHKLLRVRSDNPLSEREKEIMHWVKDGKTNWEISTILNISERTVKFHVQNIERKLDAVNKAHAVAVWMEQEAAVHSAS